MITKQQARETIEAGGSVLHNGKLMTKIEHLKHFDGTPEEKQSEIDNLEKRLAELKGDEAAAAVDGEPAPGGESSDEKAAKSGKSDSGKNEKTDKK